MVPTTQVPGAVGALHHHTAGVLEDLQVPVLGVPASEEATMFQEQGTGCFTTLDTVANARFNGPGT